MTMTGEEKLQKIQEYAKESELELKFFPGFEDAIVGVAQQFVHTVVVYDREVVIEILMERDGMSFDAAEDYFGFNIVGGYHGDGTPVFLNRVEEML
jgi:hypothetical protein